MGGGKQVQFGCGGNILEGWENHDSDVDITKRLPYDNSTVSMILAEHVVEHVPHKDAFRFFVECLRILRPGGVVRICIPVLDGIYDRKHAEDLIFNHGHEAAYSRDLIISMLWAAGFSKDQIHISWRKPIDGHYNVIGYDLDSMETARIEAIKD